MLGVKFLITDQYRINRRQEAQTTRAPDTASQLPQDSFNTSINQASMVPFPLICTYGSRLAESTPRPGDGICDYLYYDSFYKHGHNEFGEHADHTPSLKVFFGKVANGSYTATKLGIGFSQVGAARATRELNTYEGEQYLTRLWQGKGLRHFGVLDIMATADQTDNVLNLHRLLVELRSQQQDLREAEADPKPTAYLVVGVTFRTPRVGAVYTALEEFFARTPTDALIARTHLEMRDDMRPDCRITGPTIYREPYAAYQVAMVDVVQFVHEKRNSFTKLSVAVSFTMMARLYQPVDTGSHGYFSWFKVVHPYPGFQPGQSCWSIDDDEAFTSYFFLCTTEEQPYVDHLRTHAGEKAGEEDKQFVFTFSESTSRSILFDSDATIRKKYCELQRILSGVPYGIALFDLEYDALEGSNCRDWRSNFARLNITRHLVDHMARPNSGRRSSDDCLAIK
ncbi:uncharacterized protein LOC144159751 [Haemaphysalis longicornis]